MAEGDGDISNKRTIIKQICHTHIVPLLKKGSLKVNYLEEGAFKTVYHVHLTSPADPNDQNTDGDYVFRQPSSICHKWKMLAEVGAMRFVSKSNVYVPRVITYDSSSTNELGCP